MKQLLILFTGLLLTLSAQGQDNKPILMNFGIYRGNIGVSPVIALLPADTSKQIVVTARPWVGSGLTDPQPTWSRTGLALTIRLATHNTFPELTEYQLVIDGQVRVKGIITTNKDQVIVPPQFPATVLSGIYSQLGVLQGLINNASAGEVSLSKFSSFTAATSATFTQQAVDIANRVLISDYNTYKTNNALSISNINSALGLRLLTNDTTGFQRRIAGYGLYPNVDKAKLAGIANGATNVDSSLLVRKSTYALEKAVQNTIIAGKLTQAQADGLYKGVGYVPSWSELLAKPTAFVPSSHTHVAADVITDATRRFVTDAQISGWNSLSGSGFSGNYNDLTNKPTLSTVAGTGSYADLLNRPSLFSGSYADLTGKPALFSGNYADLIGKPALFSGSYQDLTNKPTIPTSASQVGAVDAGAYETNRASDQAATAAAQSTANTALTTANSATATAASNGVAIAGLTTATATLASSISATNAVVATKQGNLGYTPLNPANNLSELTPATARTNLGLGTLAVQSGSFSGSSSNTNTGDETAATIRTKLGITTLSGSNTGDQDLSGKQNLLTSGANIAIVGNTISVTGINQGSPATTDASSLTTGTLSDARLANTGTAGTVGGGGQIVESVTRDAKGRVTGITTIATPTGGGGGGSSQWTTNGSNIYYNGGNVGVGLTNPDGGIHLKMAIDSYQKGFTVEAASNDRLHLFFEQDGWTWDSYRFSDQRRVSLNFQPNGGNMGVGTRTPSEKLEVNGVVKATGGFRFADGSLQTTASSGSGGGGSSNLTYAFSVAGVNAASTDLVIYDGSTWVKSSGTVDTNPENNGKYSALQINAGSSHYDRQYTGYALFSWWKNASADRHNQLRYAISIFGIKIQVEDGIYNFTDSAWSPGNFIIRGNTEDPSKVVFNATGSETRIFRGWYWYDGTSAGQIFENISIEGIKFNQMSTATVNTSYGPITYEGASTRNLHINRCQYSQVSTTAITNFIFVKAGANRLISDVLIERLISRNLITFSRIGIEIINQENHPNSDGVTGTNIQILNCDIGGFDYCYSVAGNFSGTIIRYNLVGSNTSYGIESAGSNINAAIDHNGFYGNQNILIASNYLGENGTPQGDYAITGGQKINHNYTLGYVVGNVEIRGGGAMQFNGNDLNISGGIYFKKTQYGGVVSAEFKDNHIVSAGIGSTPNQALLYLDGASSIRGTGNTLERTGSATTALVQASGTLSTGSFFYNNTLGITSGSYFGLSSGATWNIGVNYTLTGTPINDGEPTIATFALAKAAVATAPGLRRVFLITNNELYGAPTRSIYDGTDWTHSPADKRNN